MLQISAQMLAMSSEYAVLEKNGKIVYANSGAQLLLGADCVGKKLSSVFGEDLAGIQAPSFIGDFAVGGRRHIVRACSMDGMRVLFISPTDDNPSLVNDSFIFSLRNCLNNISLSMSGLYSRDDIPPEISGTFSLLNHECFRINRIISNLSIIHSLRDKSLVLSPMQLDVSAHIRDLLDSTKLLVNDIQLQFSSPGAMPLKADPSMLDVLVLNLISNCLRHAEGCSRVSLTLSHARDKVLLTVSDDGCGIPADELHSVFDRYRHNVKLGDINKGTGFGLTAARMIAEIHGGILLLESRENQGTTVCVSLGDVAYSPEPMCDTPQHYEKSMSSLLTGLAGTLPNEFYSEKYID